MSKGRDFFLSFLYFLVDPIVSRAPVGSAAVTMGGHVPLSGSASSSPLKKLPGAGWLDHGAAQGLPFREDTPVRVPPAGRGVPPSPHVSRCVGSAPPTGARVRLGPSSRTRGRRRLLSARTVAPGAPAAFTSASSAARAPPSWGRHPASGVSRALRGRPSRGGRPAATPSRGPCPHGAPRVRFCPLLLLQIRGIVTEMDVRDLATRVPFEAVPGLSRGLRFSRHLGRSFARCRRAVRFHAFARSCPSGLLTVAFTEQKFSTSIKANLSVSSPTAYNFAVISKKPLPNPRSQSFVRRARRGSRAETVSSITCTQVKMTGTWYNVLCQSHRHPKKK